MKRIMIMLLAATMFVACKKEESEVELTPSQKLIGVWECETLRNGYGNGVQIGALFTFYEDSCDVHSVPFLDAKMFWNLDGSKLEVFETTGQARYSEMHLTWVNDNNIRLEYSVRNKGTYEGTFVKK